MMELSYFPNVMLRDGTLAYGGSQKWFHLLWRRLSGCAAVSATNLAAYYEIGMQPDTADPRGRANGNPVYTLALFRRRMNDMFREHMTSGRMGFPDPNRYVSEFVRFAARFGVTVVPETQFDRERAADAYALIERRLAASDPVVLLILQHTAKELDDITWHWMTITGLDTETDTLIVSNYGKREMWPASVVFEKKEGNQTYLIAFDMEKNGKD